jgi:hypothetical protein
MGVFASKEAANGEDGIGARGDRRRERRPALEIGVALKLLDQNEDPPHGSSE